MNERNSNRRTFYLEFIYGLSALMGAALAIPAGIYLLFPPKTKTSDQWVEAADLTQLPENSPQEVAFHENRVDGWKVTSEKATAWVVKKSNTEVVAFAPQCTHLGCAYHWDEQKKNFLCPCHASVFSANGTVLSGPAPRPLDRYDVKIEGTKLLLGGIQKA
jgi:menaquinol-cytochrome c reductase iron-sulfur subunit